MLKHLQQQTIGFHLHGVTMMENLVALLILSVGLLGLAGLQAATLRGSHDASLRSIAVQQASNMANRIRANTQGVINGDYNNISSSAPSLIEDCDINSCNATELATFDANKWNTINNSLLPGGGGTVVGTPLNTAPNIVAIPPGMPTPTEFTITVRWDAYRNGATGLGCDPSDTNDLQCIVLQVVAP